MVSASYRKTDKGYIGFIRIWEAGQLIWSESCKIVRLTAKDAIKDAQIEKADILAISQ